jgi:hypothetical protein
LSTPTLEIKVKADIKQAAIGLQTFLDEFTKAGLVSGTAAQKVQSSINQMTGATKAFGNAKFSSSFVSSSGEIVAASEKIAGAGDALKTAFVGVGETSGIDNITIALQNQANQFGVLIPSLKEFTALFSAPFLRQFGGDATQAQQALRATFNELKNGKTSFEQIVLNAKLTAAEFEKLPQPLRRVVSVIEETAAAVKNGFTQINTSSAQLKDGLDIAGSFERLSQKVSESVDRAAAKALGLETIFEKFGSSVNLSAFVAAFSNADKSVEQLEAQIFALRDAIAQTTNPAIIERFSQRLNQLVGELGNVRIKSAVKIEKIDTPAFQVPLVAPKIDLSQIQAIKASFDAATPSIDKLQAELLQVGNALDAATEKGVGRVDLLRQNFEQLKTTLATVQANALESAFVDAIKPAQQLENEIAALQTGIKTSLNPDTIERFGSRLQVLQAQLVNTKLGGLDLTQISAPLNLLQSAFVDAVKPVRQLEKELEALETAKLEATDPSSVRIFTDQIQKLKTQLASARTGSFEGSFKRIGTSSTDAATKLKKLPQASDAASFALLNLGRVAQDAPFGILGIANNLNPLLESLQRASKAAKEAGTSLGKTLLGSLVGGGGLGFALSAVSSLAIVFGDRLFGMGGKAEKSVRGIEGINVSLKTLAASNSEKFFEKLNKEVAQLAGQNAGGTVANIEKLSLALNNVSLSTETRKNALEEYNKVSAKANQLQEDDLTNLGKVNSAIDRQIELLKLRALIAGAQDKLAESFKSIFEGQFNLQRILNKTNPTLKQTAELLNNAGQEAQDLTTGLTFDQNISLAQKFGSEGDKAVRKVSDASRDAALSIRDLLKFMDNLIIKADDFGGAFEGEKNKDKKTKTQFLFQFLPFNPNGSLNEEQRSELLKAIRGFERDFANTLEGVDFDVQSAGKGDDAVINLAKDFDKKLRQGLVKFM